MANVKRGAAFCRDDTCSQFGQLFLVDPFRAVYTCPLCTHLGQVEPEYGAAFARPGQPFREVRVHFQFSGQDRIYREMAVAHDGSLFRADGVYHLYSPVIRSPDRAQRTAESILAHLNRDDPQPAVPSRAPSREDLVAEGWAVLA